MTLACPAASTESISWYLGAMEARIRVDVYDTGSGPDVTFYWKTGATRVACEADDWNLYDDVSFTCEGWAKIRGVLT